MTKRTDPREYEEAPKFAVSRCQQCDFEMVWYEDRVLYPPITSAEQPHADLPSPARDTFLEAAAVLESSPRAAAALLRLALQELCEALGEHGKLDTVIGRMVKTRGLRPTVQQALDVVRVTGNNAIHPGEIDITDDRDRAATMFAVLNAIVEDLVARPRQIQSLYDGLPESVQQQIEKRDQ